VQRGPRPQQRRPGHASSDHAERRHGEPGKAQGASAAARHGAKGVRHHLQRLELAGARPLPQHEVERTYPRSVQHWKV